MLDFLRDWVVVAISALSTFIAAIAGVFMRHAHKVQRGEGSWPPWSRILLDAPTVFVMGLTGAAAGQWLHDAYAMPELFGGVIAASLGYLGPSVVDRIVDFLERRK